MQQQSQWAERIAGLGPLILAPFQFNHLKITLMDAVDACHEAGWVSARHRHPWYEFNYVSAGNFRTTLEGQEFEARAGRFFLIPPGCYHSHRSMPGAGDDGFCLRFTLEPAGCADSTVPDGGMAAGLAQTLQTARPAAFCDDRVGALARLLAESGREALPALLAGLILSLYALWKAPGKPPAAGKSREAVLADQAVLYLSEYYPNSIRVTELSDSLNVSYRHLARVFKQATGVTIVEMLRDIRVQKAKELLLSTEKSIQEIAAEVGFENEYYFSRMFSRQAFTTPSAFRAKFRGAGQGKG